MVKCPRCERVLVIGPTGTSITLNAVQGHNPIKSDMDIVGGSVVLVSCTHCDKVLGSYFAPVTSA